MSDSDRGAGSKTLGTDLKFLIAVLLACVVGLVFGYLEGHQAERHQNSTYEYGQTAKQNAVVTCADGEASAIADCIYNEIDSAHEESNAEQDLNAQQWMARWAGLLTFFTLATTFISWTALQYLRDTFLQTAKGAQAAADATDAMLRQNKLTEAASRAWIVIEPRITSLKVTEKGIGEVGSAFDFINRGNGLARDVSYSAAAFAGYASEIDKWAETQLAHFEKAKFGIRNLGPNEKETPTMVITGLLPLPRGHPAEGEEEWLIFISAWARYRIMGFDEPHATFRLFAAGKPPDLKDNPEIGVMPITKADAGKLTADRLRIVAFGKAITT